MESRIVPCERPEPKETWPVLKICTTPKDWGGVIVLFRTEYVGTVVHTPSDKVELLGRMVDFKGNEADVGDLEWEEFEDTVELWN